MALRPDGTRAYVANADNNSVSVIDTATNSVVATIPVGNLPSAVAVRPDGARAYVANFGSDNVSVIDTATNTVTTTIAVGNGPRGVAFRPVGTRAYVTNYGGSAVSAIDTATNTVTATIPVGTFLHGVAFRPDGARAYVVSYVAYTVSVIAIGPQVAALSPGNGPAVGGTVVTLTGINFTGATAVNFGAIPAASFTVNSDTQITATAPATGSLGIVDVRVTTPDGISVNSAADDYNYDTLPVTLQSFDVK
ncbi:beta-propeller fold lactonase family protein [Tahibacter soli]|uniref:Beta-propeller fold lactonase family protein n=1 Tax=Tahibacter soli TaxID=2983605 RepID=A0A9X3YHA3_9GAMM|nr:beta-propeller fold lactonase family protein [Tahibacter soli]MDC8011030.1 beta-propeller fold lactonase family protein [Tahibacter soli]